MEFLENFRNSNKTLRISGENFHAQSTKTYFVYPEEHFWGKLLTEKVYDFISFAEFEQNLWEKMRLKNVDRFFKDACYVSGIKIGIFKK